MRAGGLAHRFLQLVALVFILSAALAGAYAGLFGEPAARELENGVRILAAQYEAHADLIDKVIRYIGVAITAILGVLTFYKAWYYAETSLAHRLAEFIDAKVTEHAALRDTYLKLVGTDAFDEVLRPAPSRRWWHVLQCLNPFGQPTLAPALHAVPTGIDSQIATLTAKIGEYRYHKATTSIVNGLECLRSAEPGPSQEDSARKALEAFRQATVDKEDDVDALELAAKLTRQMHGHRDEIQTLLERMDAAAGQQKKLLAQARARRFQAQLLFEEGGRADLDAARGPLTSAIDLINGTVALPMKERDRELGRLYELRAHVQTRRERRVWAGNDLDRSEEFYKKTDEPDRSAGLDRVAKIRAELGRLNGRKPKIRQLIAVDPVRS